MNEQEYQDKIRELSAANARLVNQIGANAGKIARLEGQLLALLTLLDKVDRKIFRTVREVKADLRGDNR